MAFSEKRISMKLSEALRQIISENGTGAIGEERLPELISQKGVFEEFPGLRDAVRAFAADGLGKELLSLSGDRARYLSDAADAADSLVLDHGLGRRAADFLIWSVSFALGVSSSEPEGLPLHMNGAAEEEEPELSDVVPGSMRWDISRYLKEAMDSLSPAGGQQHPLPEASPHGGESPLIQAEWDGKAASDWEYHNDICFQMGMDAYQGKGLYKHSFGTKYEAASLFRDAAEHGNPEAQRWLGRMYAEGDGVEKNYPESVKWYEMAQGDAEAEAALGEMCDFGEGVRQDYQEAAKWYRKAAEQGVPNAMAGLARLLLNGFGVAQDYAEAVKWYRMAAELGNLEAITELQNLGEDS